MNKLTKFSRAIVTIVVTLAVGLPSLAYNFEVDGIYYRTTNAPNNTVEITYRGNSASDYSDEYSGNVTIPESVSYNGNTYSVTSIGNYAFSGCDGLTSVVIPNSVTSIGDYAFFGCDGLTSVVIPNSVTSIGNYAFSACGGLTTITIPNSVTTIGDDAFSHCSGLTSVVIPNSVTSIGNEAFYYCVGLTSVTIGNSVASIGNYAFEKCHKLGTVTSLNPTPPTCGAGVFNEISSYARLKVPENSISAYKSANVWKDFYSIVTGITDVVADEDNATEVARYDANGRLLSKPAHGINIIKMSDGTTRKEWVK